MAAAVAVRPTSGRRRAPPGPRSACVFWSRAAAAGGGDKYAGPGTTNYGGSAGPSPTFGTGYSDRRCAGDEFRRGSRRERLRKRIAGDSGDGWPRGARRRWHRRRWRRRWRRPLRRRRGRLQLGRRRRRPGLHLLRHRGVEHDDRHRHHRPPVGLADLHRGDLGAGGPAGDHADRWRCRRRPPPPSAAPCKVPDLSGRSLKAARKVLSARAASSEPSSARPKAQRRSSARRRNPANRWHRAPPST